jgi:hypothetical protein
MADRRGFGVQRREGAGRSPYLSLIGRAALVLDAADAVDSAGVLTSWTARVGAAPTVTSAPSVDTDSGQRAVRFNITSGDVITGTNQLLTLDASTVTAMQAANAGTLVFVARVGTGQGSVAGLIAETATGGDPWYPLSDTRIYDNNLSMSRKDPASNPPNLTLRHCYHVGSSASEWTSRINGPVYVTTATNAYAFRTAATIGGRVGRAFYGRIFGVYLFPFVLSADERTTLQAFIASRWGITFS